MEGPCLLEVMHSAQDVIVSNILESVAEELQEYVASVKILRLCEIKDIKFSQVRTKIIALG